MSAMPWIKPVRNAVWAAALALAAMSVAGNSAWAQAAAAEDDDIEDHVLNADKRMLNVILAPLGLGSASRSRHHLSRTLAAGRAAGT